MSKVSVREAGQLTGKARDTINQATIKGTLSYTINGRGHKEIDVAELERVYPLVKSVDEIKTSEPVRQDGVRTSVDVSGELRVLRERLESAQRETDIRERERRQLEAEIENLRTSLEKAQDQGKAILLLADQRESEEGRQAEERQQMQALNETVELLKRQNRAIYRKLKAQQEKKTFWQRMFS